jgi:predicted small lipoprotein YifL
MKRVLLHLLMVIMVFALAGCSGFGLPTAFPMPTARPLAAVDTPEPSAPASAAGSGSAEQPAYQAPTSPGADPFELISLDSLYATLEDLTAIQPYSGWRNSASEGETEALDYVADKLDGMSYLASLGMEQERQTFRVPTATDLWETRLHVTVGGQEIEVPADGLRGNRDHARLARQVDSDGVLNDANRDPVVVEGSVLVIGSVNELKALTPADVRDKIVFLDYATIDRSLMSTNDAVTLAWGLAEKGPAGVVLITSFSNVPGVSHGAFVGDGCAFTWVEVEPLPPVLYTRLEDMAKAGIEGWEDLEQIEAARLTWDADVFAPGTSGNLVARIPGADASQAMILGAHIDSPNAPGALDDGSGSAILLEVVRVLDAAQLKPPTDLVLVWFGSEELSLFGAAHFVATHQELLDRTRAMLQIDALSRPLDGIDADLRLVAWPFGRHGDPRLVWPETLSESASARNVETVPFEAYYAYSDNSPFAGFDVPNADLIYEPIVGSDASIHYYAHYHDPYDTVDLAREVSGVFEGMTRVALSAALDTSGDVAAVRVSPGADRRAVFVGSHTEALHMSPVTFTELGMAWAMEGFDVDLIPYGQTVTSSDLEDADLVVVLPVLDFPTAEGGLDLYDEAWAPEEVDVLEAYAADGGLLVLTNSLQRLKYGTVGLDANEDWEDANALASKFGVVYKDGSMGGYRAEIEGDSPLVSGVEFLELGEANGVPFSLSGSEWQVLASVGDKPAAALADYGTAGGEVLALADVAMLSAGWTEIPNLPFWRNLARYARSRQSQ